MPATTRAIPPRPPEIRYGTHLKPESLSPEQVAELTAIVRGKQPAGRDIWFILVHSNYLNEGRLRYRATVYFTPDETSPRLRRGRYTHVDSELYKMRRELIRQKLLPEDDAALPDYVQVSSAAQPFVGTVSIPNRSLRPFYPPDNIIAADLIAIVDIARAAHDAEALPSEIDDPICRIERSGDDFRVDFGAQDGPLAGGGSFVIVHKIPNGYVADRHLGVWHS